ncbi:MAG: DUF3014 domain-containing protein [Acidobacteria bacterium]|nr:DUF3014 domain-containing protein [Acidobacteriota bacterium]
MPIDDLPLDRPASLTPGAAPPPSPSPWRWVVVGLGGLAAGALLTFWWLGRSQPPTATPAPTTATDMAVASNRPKRQFLSLPSLDASDTLLAELVATLSRHPTLSRLLATKGLVRSATLAVVQIGDGRTPAAPLETLRPATRLRLSGASPSRVDPKSYARWDAAVGALVSISPADAAQLYVNVKPLFDQAYIELGHPAGDFDNAIVEAIAMLDDVPEDAEPALLERHTGGYYEHVSDTLKALPPVQKQFLLIGPDHRRKIQAWLHAFASNLDLTLR